MLLIIGLALAALNPASGEIQPCCEGNSSVSLMGEDEDYVCWDHLRNIFSNVTVQCDTQLTPHYMEHYNYTVNDGGVLTLTSNIFADENQTEKGQYCLDEQLTQLTPNVLKMDVILRCDTNNGQGNSSIFLSYCVAASAAFYFLITLIYLALSELRDVTGKNIICMCVSIAMGLSLYTAINSVAYENLDLCTTAGFFAYFFLIASFLWMNVISIECLNSLKRANIPDFGWDRFIRYSIYAWGLSILCSVILVIVNYAPGNHERPGPGYTRCWFMNNEQQWIYFYSVMTIVIVANMGIFIYMSCIIYSSQFSSNAVRSIKFKLAMSIKLFVIMGLPWALEIITSFVADPTTESPMYLKVVVTVIALQGVFMFMVLVVLRKRCIKAMHRRGWFLCLSEPIERYLAVADDEEDDIIQHTDVPLDSNHVQ